MEIEFIKNIDNMYNTLGGQVLFFATNFIFNYLSDFSISKEKNS